MTDKPQLDEAALKTMEALLRQPPKQHSEMKIGKPKGKKAVSPKKPAKKSRGG